MSSELAKCQQCGRTLNEWFVGIDKSKLNPKESMYCYGGCMTVSPWRTHREYRDSITTARAAELKG